MISLLNFLRGLLFALSWICLEILYAFAGEIVFGLLCLGIVWLIGSVPGQPYVRVGLVGGIVVFSLVYVCQRSIDAATEKAMNAPRDNR